MFSVRPSTVFQYIISPSYLGPDQSFDRELPGNEQLGISSRSLGEPSKHSLMVHRSEQPHMTNEGMVHMDFSPALA